MPKLPVRFSIFIALRVPPELEELLQIKAKESGYKADEFAAFVRDSLAALVLPEILKSELVKTNSIWFLNDGKKSLEFSIAKPVTKLEKIKKLAQYGIDSYKKYFANITQAEVEMKNDMFVEIAKELK